MVKKQSSAASGIDISTITREQKIAAVVKVLTDKQLLRFSEHTSHADQKMLKAWFVDALVDAMPALTEQEISRRDPVARFLMSNMPVIIQLNTLQGAPIVSHPDETTTLLHIYQNSTAAFIDQLDHALNQAAEDEIRTNREIIVAETDSARLPKDEKKPKPQRNVRGRRYDPQAAELVNDGSQKNTNADLTYFARMRLGKIDYDGLDTTALENDQSISQNHYDCILEQGGGRWLWEYLHHYLMSEEALASKTPGRWFRDMCVICGVSTNVLSEKHGKGRNTQAFWNAIQNDNYPPNTNDIYNRTVLQHLRTALSVYLPEPTKAGYGTRTGSYSGYQIPAGSLFGLPTIRLEDGTEKTDPEMIEKLLRKLFREHHVEIANATHTLRHIKRISDAYREGTISQEEVLETNLIKTGSMLHRVLWQYRYGLKSRYSRTTPEYIQLYSCLFNDQTVNLAGMYEALRHLNTTHWHIAETELESILESFRWLPATKSNLFHDGKMRDRSATWDYATTHHDGTIGDLLRTYRETRGMALTDLPLIKNKTFTKAFVNQYEAGKISESATCNRSLSYKTASYHVKRLDKRYYVPDGSGRIENLWDLPMNASGTEIREDVVDYINHFRERSNARKKLHEHWKNISDIVDELVKTPQALRPNNKDPRRQIQGSFTQGVQKEKQQPLRAILESVTAEQFALYPDEPFPLITLPNGTEVLVRRNKQGEQPQLLESEMHLWRDWLQQEMTLEPRSPARNSSAC